MNKTQHTVLVIDDNDINRKYIKSVLSSNDFQPIITSGGLEALKYLENDKPDLILIDIQMPEMDGFECYTRIKSLGLNSPILAITAFSDSGDKKTIIAHGFDDYIIKPVKPADLVATINYWINHSGSSRKGSFSSEGEHISNEVLFELLKYIDANSLNELIDEFVEETKSGIETIAKLKDNNKYTEILSILHTIKGNAGSFGFNKLSSFASQLEIMIKEGKLDKAENELNHFLEYASLLLRDYKRLLKTD